MSGAWIWIEDLRDALRHDEELPHYQILSNSLRDLILQGNLAPGTKLPPTRNLADDLQCSRNTVIGAFQLLIEAGFIESRVGSGTYVSKVLPTSVLKMRRDQAPKHSQRKRFLSDRGQRLSRFTPPFKGPRKPAFIPGLADGSLFPFDVWARLVMSTQQELGGALLESTSPSGYWPLREAIADHLHKTQGIRRLPQQIIMTGLSVQAVDLIARMLADPGDSIWVEDPGPRHLREPLLAADMVMVPVPVDDEGLMVEHGIGLAPDARLAVVNPSSHFPLGVNLSLSRKLKLLGWAAETGAWIIEDGIPEVRGSGHQPDDSLLRLDTRSRGGYDRVLRIGSFSRTCLPDIKMGYVVVPEDLVDSFERARAGADYSISTLIQPAFSRFLDQGHFTAHLRRVRTHLAERHTAMVEGLGQHLDDLLEPVPSQPGSEICCYLTNGVAAKVSDGDIEKACASAGITVTAVSKHYLEARRKQGLVLGYTAVPAEKITTYLKELEQVIRKLIATRA
ncbi:PLP-dependent aminotransferase family protein [Limibacillus sp. MBR-115]|jgi:GntR family transcriptional regulator/MocR family aminotransferase|uniref:aminotransferase-like domain-containing protein n=1 Tax=Limibacillus sp. MBR-115 TaxID=3156465 RepID=UPI003391F877